MDRNKEPSYINSAGHLDPRRSTNQHSRSKHWPRESAKPHSHSPHQVEGPRRFTLIRTNPAGGDPECLRVSSRVNTIRILKYFKRIMEGNEQNKPILNKLACIFLVFFKDCITHIQVYFTSSSCIISIYK